VGSQWIGTTKQTAWLEASSAFRLDCPSPDFHCQRRPRASDPHPHTCRRTLGPPRTDNVPRLRSTSESAQCWPGREKRVKLFTIPALGHFCAKREHARNDHHDHEWCGLWIPPCLHIRVPAGQGAATMVPNTHTVADAIPADHYWLSARRCGGIYQVFGQRVRC
jgi:hypothetical protein